MAWLRGVDLNHRPLGYEPNELPDCSTPQNHRNAPALIGQLDSPAGTILVASASYNGIVPRILALALFTATLRLSAQTPFFPLRDIKPGLHGTGRTVFSGNQVE